MSLRLSPRLRVVADLVPAGYPVTDVGTDHALLPIHLVASGRSPRALAVDVAEGPLRAAREAVRSSGVTAVEVRQSDGLAAVHPDESEVVVIAGMGARLMMSILDAGHPRGAGRRAVILQPNTDWPTARRGLARLGLRIVDEVLVEDSGRHYLALRAEPGSGAEMDALDAELGPVARRARTPAYLAWLASERKRLERAVRAAGTGATPALLGSLRRIVDALGDAQAS